MRILAGLRPLWSIILVVTLLLIPLMLVGVVPPTWALGVAAAILVSALLLGAAPRSPAHPALEMLPPVRGRWVALNSPGQKLPSHGTRALGQYAAVDIIRPNTPDTPAMVRNARRGSFPAEFPTFGANIYTMAAGTVIQVSSQTRDHRARNTWQALTFMVTLEGLLRSLIGVRALFGNHVIVDHGNGVFAVYAHLRRGSVAVQQGARVPAGKKIAEVGNTGNSSVPHLHVHLMNRGDPNTAAGLKMTWSNLVLTDEIDGSLQEMAKPPAGDSLGAMPRNGEIFLARGPAPGP